MKKTFYKNLFRDVRKTLSRFLSIVIIIAMGVAFYAGVRATSPDMKKSVDFYFSETDFMDFKLISTLGLTEDDVIEVQKLINIKSAEGSFSLDAVVEKNTRALVVNVNSIPSVDGINSVKILTGRMAENNNEVVVEDGFLKENKFKIGDEIELKSGKDTKIGDDLKNSTFKIVGTALSPLYLSAQRQLSSVGNGSVKGFIYILPDVFKSEVFTEIYVKSNSEGSKDSLLFNEDYKETSKTIEQNLKELGVIRSEIRYSQVLGDAQSKINTAEEELNASKKEAGDKFLEGYKQINDAKAKIKQGKIELAKNQTEIDGKERYYLVGEMAEMSKLSNSHVAMMHDKIKSNIPYLSFLSAVSYYTALNLDNNDNKIEIDYMSMMLPIWLLKREDKFSSAQKRMEERFIGEHSVKIITLGMEKELKIVVKNTKCRIE